MRKPEVLISIILISNSFLIFAQSNPISIDLQNNGNRVDAKFYFADNVASPPTVILLHGFPGNANSPFGLAEILNKSGINILVFNYEGSFNSEGIFSFENCMNDLDIAAAFLKQKKNIQQFSIDTSKIFVCGYSMGAAFALSAAVHNPEIRKIIAVAGGNDLSIYLQKIKSDPAFRTAFEKKIAASLIPDGPIRGDSAYFHNYFDKIIPNVDYFDLIKNANKFSNKKILFITAWLDTAVPMEEFIIPAYRHLKTMNPESVSIKALETDHYFSNARDALADSIMEWVKK